MFIYAYRDYSPVYSPHVQQALIGPCSVLSRISQHSVQVVPLEQNIEHGDPMSGGYEGLFGPLSVATDTWQRDNDPFGPGQTLENPDNVVGCHNFLSISFGVSRFRKILARSPT